MEMRCQQNDGRRRLNLLPPASRAATAAAAAWNCASSFSRLAPSAIKYGALVRATL